MKLWRNTLSCQLVWDHNLLVVSNLMIRWTQMKKRSTLNLSLLASLVSGMLNHQSHLKAKKSKFLTQVQQKYASGTRKNKML